MFLFGIILKEIVAALHRIYLNVSTVDSRYLDFGYLEQPLISKRKSDPRFNTEI